MHNATDNVISLAKFTPKGRLGAMFAQAKAYNQINAQLSKILPNEINSLELCLIKDSVATFVANNQAVAFRAQKQHKLLLELLTSLEGLEKINKIAIKISLSAPR